ncbi:thioesterase domain-containing protein [Streptomyces sp. MST-110588]|uniref:thioesterase domain-containing protein n=1 Tax=Streptomyces sp. MST-110588 TaxID=2833628 RepID=UPI001F5E330C|nr:thioesterase domain-containing protein [Streptomyces sp. MST-110588]
MALGTKSIWLRRHATAAPPRLRLLCLPHAGGSARFFHDWGRAFGDDVEVLAARYPGRQERIAEDPCDTVEELAGALADELPPLLDTPLAVFGHSMGASVGHELALRLQARHRVTPHLLMVSCRKPPHLLTPSTAALADDTALIAEVQRLGGTDAALLADTDLRELVFPAIRADFAAVARYTARPGIPLDCPVAGYLGAGDPDIAAHDMAGWAAVAPKGFGLTVLPGDHFYLTAQRGTLVADIRARLAPQWRAPPPRLGGPAGSVYSTRRRPCWTSSKAAHNADSLRAIEILAALEKQFAVVINQSELPRMVNLKGVYEVVAESAGW